MSLAFYDRCLVTFAKRRFPTAIPHPSVGAMLWDAGGLDEEERPVREGQPSATVTVIIKMTYDFAGETVVVAEEQQRLSAGEEAPEGDLLVYPSDFVLDKPCCDVMVVGSAYAETAVERIEAEVTVGRVRAQFLARAGAPTTHIPLRPPYLWTRGEARRSIYLGPDRVDSTLMGIAHPDLQLGGLDIRKPITLVGLCPDRPEKTLKLPRVRPRALLMADARNEEVALACDTAWIDTDHQVMILVWRGHVMATRAGATEFRRVAVAVDAIDNYRSWPEMLGEQQDGVIQRIDTVERAKTKESLAIEDDSDLALSLLWTGDGGEPRLSLERYAEITAALRKQPGQREAVLADHEMTEAAYALEERMWTERITRGIANGDTSLATRLDALIREGGD